MDALLQLCGLWSETFRQLTEKRDRVADNLSFQYLGKFIGDKTPRS